MFFFLSIAGMFFSPRVGFPGGIIIKIIVALKGIRYETLTCENLIPTETVQN